MNTNIDVFIMLYKPNEKYFSLRESLKMQSIKCNIVEKETIDPKEFNHGTSRNELVKNTTSPYFIFMTQDAIPYNEYLIENLLNGLNSDKNISCAYARQIPYPNTNAIEKYTREFNYGDKDIIKDKNTETKYGIKNYFCSNVCQIYKRDIFESLGGFENNVILNEDMFYAYKAIQSGYKVLYKSSAKVYHSHNYTLEEYFKRNFDIGVSQSMMNEEKRKYSIKIDFDSIPSINEGKKLVKNSFCYFLKKLDIINIFKLFIYSLCKYLGYKKGKNYKSISIKKCKKYSMNPLFFDNIDNY
ncbi:MAG: glycosyltransferase [Eubacteriales bacterium]|nr:glycosyltransferase [Eubacteriales bacterium]